MKGFWYVVESMLAITVMILFLVSIGSTVVKLSSTEVTKKGYEALKGLEEQGLLRQYVKARDAEGLNRFVNITGFNHTIRICDTTGNCVGRAPSNAANLYIANYIVAGDDVYDPNNVILYIYTTTR